MEVGDLVSERYRLVRRIGAGPLTVAFQAQDEALDRVVTVKALRLELAADREVAQRFLQQAQRMTDLSHPNLALVYGAGSDDGTPYRVTEYLPGGSLRDRLDREGALAADEAITIAIAIAAAVEACHVRGILHGNLTSQNVMFAEQGDLKVTDGGMDQVMAAVSTEGGAIPAGLAAYLSPEKIAGQTLTPASDVYAIGVVCFEALAGHPPFSGPSPAETALMHLRQEVPPPPVQDAALASIVRKMLAKDPRARYASAQQLHQILLAYRRQRTGPERPPTVPESAAKTRDGSPLETEAPIRPVRVPEPPAPAQEELELEGIDWPFVLLGALAIVAILGLIVLWTVVYRRYTMPLG